MLDLTEKDFKVAIINIFTELKERMIKEGTITNREYFKKKRQIIRQEPKKNS